MMLVVDDIEAIRAQLTEKGFPVSEVFHDEGGVFHHAGEEKRVPGPAADHASYGSFVSFTDPDGNTWYVQEVTSRLPGRVDQTATTYGSAEISPAPFVEPRRLTVSTRADGSRGRELA